MPSSRGVVSREELTDSDEELIRRFQAGESSALDGLVRRWNLRALTLSLRLLGSREDAEDVSQRALLRVSEHLDSFRGASRFGTWFYRVVVNLCRDRARAGSHLRAALEERSGRIGAGLESSPPRPFEILSARERARAIAFAVADLPAREREIVVLRHYHDQSFVRIAEILDLPVTTVKSRMTKALETLAARLQGQEP